MINREEAIVLLKKYLRDEDNIRYSLAVEAVIREIAKKLSTSKYWVEVVIKEVKSMSVRGGF